MKSEHYKNHPNDIEPTKKEKYWNCKYEQLRHKYKINDIKKVISILLLKTQIKQDSNIKNMLIDMYPNEYRSALNATMEKFGMSERKEVRMKKIIKSMRLKDRNIIK